MSLIKLLPHIREDLHGLTPNDPQMMGWEIKKFNIENLWNKTTGKNVVVAVIDTGCDYNHPDIKNNILEGKNFVDNNNDPMDGNGHGTHVSSTICATNNNFGMVGIAPDTKIIPIKCLANNGSGEEDAVASGIIWAANKKVDFITMSIGSPRSSAKIENAVNYASSNGVVIFCAAGNSGPNTDIMYPAKYDNTISIGAINKYLNRTNFTCSGDSLDFLAPGQDIMGCVPKNSYALMSGTSMSNTFAVGCAALLCSYNKKYQRYNLKTAEDYINVFKSKSQKLANLEYAGKKRYEGYGIMYPVL